MTNSEWIKNMECVSALREAQTPGYKAQNSLGQAQSCKFTAGDGYRSSFWSLQPDSNVVPLTLLTNSKAQPDRDLSRSVFAVVKHIWTEASLELEEKCAQVFSVLLPSPIFDPALHNSVDTLCVIVVIST